MTIPFFSPAGTFCYLITTVEQLDNLREHIQKRSDVAVLDKYEWSYRLRSQIGDCWNAINLRVLRG